MNRSDAVLQILLLGSWQMSGGPDREPRRKEQALLAYLALEADRPHSRDALTGLFWPELPTTRARNNLRVALSRLKQHLAGTSSLETSRHTVRFIPSPQLYLDAHHFLSLLNTVDQHPHSTLATCHSCRAALQQAVDLYRGELMAGFFLQDCLAFEEWLFIWRERLHVQVLDRLDRLVQAAMADGRFAAAEQNARRQIELDPLRESACRQLMQSLTVEGRRTAALNQFQTFAALLQAELGVEPEAETLQLYRQIRSGAYPPAAANGHLPPAGPALPPRATLPEIITPFVGRETELAQLVERFSRPGHRLISLVGPGGIGKTRLALQAARNSRASFPDGVFFVPLDGIQSAAEIPAAVAESIGVPINRQVLDILP